jgi:hypothetical protein
MAVSVTLHGEFEHGTPVLFDTGMRPWWASLGRLALEVVLVNASPA